VRIGRPVGKRALAASHLSADPQLMHKARCGAMPTEETDWSTPGVRDLPEDDLGASAYGLTGRVLAPYILTALIERPICY
jgi:hypothetical protein